jgi:hypothetical protein
MDSVLKPRDLGLELGDFWLGMGDMMLELVGWGAEVGDF